MFRRGFLASSRSQRVLYVRSKWGFGLAQPDAVISRHLRGRPTIPDECVVADIPFPTSSRYQLSLALPDCDSLRPAAMGCARAFEEQRPPERFFRPARDPKGVETGCSTDHHLLLRC
jgi:hypothetical protein